MPTHLLPARLRATVTALSLTVLSLTALSLTALSPQPAHAQSSAPAADCADADLVFLPAPIAPWKGAPLRVVAVSEKPFAGTLSLIAPNGSVAASSPDRQGGPPYFWYAEVASPAAGTWRAAIDRRGASCSHAIVVSATEPPRPQPADGSLWPIRAAWDRTTENLFSVWIEKLFDAPVEDEPSWTALHFVLRDRSRNFLFNYLGLNEDQMNMVIRPDCADLPYFLRAYFAFKMGLPFGYSKCSRGGGGHPPRCSVWWNIQHMEPSAQHDQAELPDGDGGVTGTPLAPAAATPPAATPIPGKPPKAPPATWAVHSPDAARHLGLANAFGRYLSGPLADGVHSASARTALADENSDYYPVPLTVETLRPGTVYVDPYGHVLMISRRIAQTDTAAGIIFAVDAQPDGTVARKRFWQGNFLFATDPGLGGPGFKRFRPIFRDKAGDLRRLTNADIGRNASYADFGLEQAKLTIEGFYDRMDDVMSPSPLDPRAALMEKIAALEEQVKTRVNSVENGRKFQSSGKRDAEMPEGATIFETSGAWEDFSTPSRDLRLLIAIDVVRGFPDHVARRGDHYAMPAGTSVAAVKAELEAVLAQELAARKFSYPRTDGSTWTLSLKDVLDRSTLLEMAYNPNDCVELRWGAAEGSEEAGTCKRHAPAAQRARMSEYRAWFHDRRRPPRPTG